MAEFLNIQYILFLNTILSFACVGVISLSLWPFQGVFHQWLFKQSKYTWNTHVMMGWFEVGCIGLFTANLHALLTYDEQTGTEAYDTVLLINIAMHGLWGIHNFHQIIRKISNQDKETFNELRRIYPILFYSIAGACGSALVRNLYAYFVPVDELNMVVIIITWVWEWCSLVIVLCDFGYFLLKEIKWRANVVSTTTTDTTNLGEVIAPSSPSSVDNSPTS